MTVERIRQSRPFPNVKLHGLPADEHDDAQSIGFNIGSMHGHATDFWSGRTLFQNCAERRLFDPSNGDIYHAWQLCAARDCVMSIYHFGRIIEGIDVSLGKCPSVRKVIDLNRKKDARKRFKQKFPSFIEIRNAISHSAERTKTTKDAERHGRAKGGKTIEITPDLSIRFAEDFPDFILFDNIHGTTFSSTWEGNIVRCDVSDQAGIHLDEIISEYWVAFDAIIDPNPSAPPTITTSSTPTRDF